MAGMNAYENVAAMVADSTLKVGDIIDVLGRYTFDDYGGNEYMIVAAGTGAEDGGEFINLANGLQAKGTFPSGYVNVCQFGHSGLADMVRADTMKAFNAAAAYADRVRQKWPETVSGTGPIIDLPPGKYRLGEAVATAATWRLSDGVKLLENPGVPPTNHADMKNLTGTVIKWQGVRQSGTLYVGDPSSHYQKVIAKSMSAEVMGISDKASGGVTGVSCTSDQDAPHQGCIGVISIGINDNTDPAAYSVWAGYTEFYRLPGVMGNAFGAEITGFNDADLKSYNPWQQPGNGAGATVGFWMSAGGNYGNDGTGAKKKAGFPCTAVMGVIGKDGTLWDRGITFFRESLLTGEMVSGTEDYSVAWYSKSDGRVGLLTAKEHQMFGRNGPAVKSTTGRYAALGSGQDLETHNIDVLVGPDARATMFRESVQTTGAYVNGAANISQTTEIMRALTGLFTKYEQTATTFRATDALVDLGDETHRFQRVYTVNGTLQTSDEREKHDIKSVEDRVLDAWSEVEFIQYRWKEGDDRIHAGVVAQRVEEAFKRHCLRAEDYGVLIREEDRYSISYNEAFALESALMRRRMDRLEARA